MATSERWPPVSMGYWKYMSHLSWDLQRVPSRTLQTPWWVSNSKNSVPSCLYLQICTAGWQQLHQKQTDPYPTLPFQFQLLNRVLPRNRDYYRVLACPAPHTCLPFYVRKSLMIIMVSPLNKLLDVNFKPQWPMAFSKPVTMGPWSNTSNMRRARYRAPCCTVLLYQLLNHHPIWNNSICTARNTSDSAHDACRVTWNVAGQGLLIWDASTHAQAHTQMHFALESVVHQKHQTKRNWFTLRVSSLRSHVWRNDAYSWSFYFLHIF